MITIRRLQPADAAAFNALRLQGLRDEPRAFASSFEEERDKPLADIAAAFAVDAGRIVFGAFDGARLVGVLGISREKYAKLAHKAFLSGMYVDPSGRGQGVGRQLLSHVIGFAASQDGLRQLTLIASADNAAAIALYESVGFKAFGHEPAALQVDGAFHDDVHMVCFLGPTPAG